MAGAADFLPPFSFCAAIISCLCAQHLQELSSSLKLLLLSFLILLSSASLPQLSLVPLLPHSFLLSIGECTLSAGHSARSSWLYLR